MSETKQFDGKRAGRPKGSKTKNRSRKIPPDLQWVVDNLDAKTVKDTTSTRMAILKWARDDRAKFMQKIMSVMLAPEEAKPDVETKYSTEECVRIVDELLAAFKKEKK